VSLISKKLLFKFVVNRISDDITTSFGETVCVFRTVVFWSLSSEKNEKKLTVFVVAIHNQTSSGASATDLPTPQPTPVPTPAPSNSIVCLRSALRSYLFRARILSANTEKKPARDWRSTTIEF
jgi:hypothetical protein